MKDFEGIIIISILKETTFTIYIVNVSIDAKVFQTLLPQALTITILFTLFPVPL